jgi:hypothetical protein
MLGIRLRVSHNRNGEHMSVPDALSRDFVEGSVLFE